MLTPDQAIRPGLAVLKSNQYAEAIDQLELFCQLYPDGESVYYLQAQMGLVKAYHATGQTQQAIALLRQLGDSSNPKVTAWVKQTLPKLTPASAPTTTTNTAENVADLSQYLTQRQQLTPTQTPLRVAGAIASELPGVQIQPSGSMQPPSPTLGSTSDATPTSNVELKTLTMFHRHYQQDLQTILAKFEQRRRQIVWTVAIIQVVLLALGISIIAVGVPGLWGFVLGGYAIASGTIYRQIIKPYRHEFKHKVIRKIVEFVDPNGSFIYSFKPNQQSNYNAFLSSRLYANRPPDRFSEEDCVSGTLGQTHIFFSEIHAERKTKDSDGHRKYTTLFQGLFFQANFNKSFKGTTFIFPDLAERLLGGFGKALQAKKSRHGELIKLEDPEFERLFAVYGSDQIEARYILSTSLMQRLIDLRKKVNQEIFVAFVANQIYIGISSSQDLFEPRVFRSMLEFAPAHEYFETLQMMLGIVDDLNLNLRIWNA